MLASGWLLGGIAAPGAAGLRAAARRLPACCCCLPAGRRWLKSATIYAADHT